MIVVADSSPLHYLILLDAADVLQQLYFEVLIPHVVVDELTSADAPEEVRKWLSRPRTWLRVVAVHVSQFASVSDRLDAGERAAIALAETLHADLLLIDETAGRAEARRRQIRVTGTLGVLRAAAERGLVDVPTVLDRLHNTSFYVDQNLIDEVFGRWLE